MRTVPFLPEPGPIEQEDRTVIRVTRLNGEQFALNPDLIERVEVLTEIREYRAGILATSYEMDRGEYRRATTDGAGPLEGVPATSSVVPFPSREER
jgi:flagellar protein FlbD